MTNRSSISSFCFRVQDAGKDLGVTNDLMVYKFLQHVPKGNKVYEKLTETIKTNMTEQDITAVFDKVQNKVLSYSSNIKVQRGSVCC